MNEFLKKRLSPNERYGLRLTLLALAFLIVVLPFGLLLTRVTETGDIPRIDSTVVEDLHEWVRDSPAMVKFWQVVSFLGSPAWFYVVVGIAAIALFRQGHPRLALFLVVTGLLGGALDSIVKIVVDRPRPALDNPVAHAHGKSFPSGHSMTSVVNYGSLLLVFLPTMAKKWRPIAWVTVIVVVLAVGLSRLILGVHYVTDVLGGYLLGVAWLALSTAAFSIWRVERGKAPVKPERGLAPEAF